MSFALGRVLSSWFLALCKQKPSLVLELARELLELVGSMSNIQSRAEMFTCVVSGTRRAGSTSTRQGLAR